MVLIVKIWWLCCRRDLMVLLGLGVVCCCGCLVVFFKMGFGGWHGGGNYCGCCVCFFLSFCGCFWQFLAVLGGVVSKFFCFYFLLWLVTTGRGRKRGRGREREIVKNEYLNKVRKEIEFGMLGVL